VLVEPAVHGQIDAAVTAHAIAGGLARFFAPDA
jgi:hypothetical protein